MPELRCPECGHSPSFSHHDYGGCSEIVSGRDDFVRHCHCMLTPYQALRAAQYEKAIIYLRQLGFIHRRHLHQRKKADAVCEMNKIKTAVAAYRAVGILGRKVKHDPA